MTRSKKQEMGFWEKLIYTQPKISQSSTVTEHMSAMVKNQRTKIPIRTSKSKTKNSRRKARKKAMQMSLKLQLLKIKLCQRKYNNRKKRFHQLPLAKIISRTQSKTFSR